MANYEYGRDEAHVHTVANVWPSESLPGMTHELVLTTRNIVINGKGMFGGDKGTTVYSLRNVVVIDGRVQVKLGKKPNGLHNIDIRFRDGARQFGLRDKREAKYVVQKIEELVSGSGGAPDAFDSSASAVVADTMKDTVDTLKSAFGFKSQSAAPPAAVARTCGSCGAPVSGLKGKVTICSYCDSPATL